MHTIDLQFDSLKMFSFSHSCQTSAQLISLLKRSGWKEKINFYIQLERKLNLHVLPISQNILEASWCDLFKENNLNTLHKVISCLKAYVQAFQFQNFRLEKEVIIALVSLAKINKEELNRKLIDIVVILISRSKSFSIQNGPSHQITADFYSQMHPTFLIGSQEKATQEEQTQQTKKYSTFQSKNLLVSVLISIMKGCRKQTFNFCLRVIKNLRQKQILGDNQLDELQEFSKVLNFLLSGNSFDYNLNQNDTNKNERSRQTFQVRIL